MENQDKQADAVSKHTPGKLMIWRHGTDSDPSCVLSIHNENLLFQTLGGNDLANAQRIVKCWNLCEDIPTEDLEDYVVVSKWD